VVIIFNNLRKTIMKNAFIIFICLGFLFSCDELESKANELDSKVEKKLEEARCDWCGGFGTPLRGEGMEFCSNKCVSEYTEHHRVK